MVVIGIAAATVVAFIASSVYYSVVAPLERRALGDGALDRGAVVPWKVALELVRTALVAGAVAWLAAWAGHQGLSSTLLLAVILWVAFPAVLLTGSVMWERVAPVTAAMHAGDWLLKLLIVAVAVGLLH
jgi:hypothetical protein